MSFPKRWCGKLFHSLCRFIPPNLRTGLEFWPICTHGSAYWKLTINWLGLRQSQWSHYFRNACMKNVIINRQRDNQRKKGLQTKLPAYRHTRIADKPTYRHNKKCTKHKKGRQAGGKKIFTKMVGYCYTYKSNCPNAAERTCSDQKETNPIDIINTVLVDLCLEVNYSRHKTYKLQRNIITLLEVQRIIVYWK